MILKVRDNLIDTLLWNLIIGILSSESIRCSRTTSNVNWICLNGDKKPSAIGRRGLFPLTAGVMHYFLYSSVYLYVTGLCENEGGLWAWIFHGCLITGNMVCFYHKMHIVPGSPLFTAMGKLVLPGCGVLRCILNRSDEKHGLYF